MSQQSGQRANATSNTHISAKEIDKENYLVEDIPLENGFVIRKRDNKWFTTLGDTMVSEPTEKYTEQLEQIDDLNWKFITKVIIHIVKAMKDIDNIKDKMTVEVKNSL